MSTSVPDLDRWFDLIGRRRVAKQRGRKLESRSRNFRDEWGPPLAADLELFPRVGAIVTLVDVATTVTCTGSHPKKAKMKNLLTRSNFTAWQLKIQNQNKKIYNNNNKEYRSYQNNLSILAFSPRAYGGVHIMHWLDQYSVAMSFSWRVSSRSRHVEFISFLFSLFLDLVIGYPSTFPPSLATKYLLFIMENIMVTRLSPLHLTPTFFLSTCHAIS